MDILPKELNLCLRNPTVLDGQIIYLIRSRTKIRHSNLSNLQGSVGCLIANRLGIQGVEIYRTADLFTFFLETIVSSYSCQPDRDAPTCREVSVDFVQKWFESVIATKVNLPQSLLMDQIVPIQSTTMIGNITLHRGALLHMVGYCAKASASKPSWMQIRDSRPSLMTSLSIAEDNRENRHVRGKSYKLTALGGFSSEQVSGILDMGNSWMRFVCYKGQEATLTDDAPFRKSDYPSRYFFMRF